MIAAFNRGFSIRANATVPQLFRPGYLLDYGIFSTTQIWYSVEAVQNTEIITLVMVFVLIDTTVNSNLTYRFNKQFVYTSSIGPNLTMTDPSFYDQYCFMAGVNSFVYNYTVIPDFTFTYPTMVLSCKQSAVPTTANYSINLTTLNLYYIACTAPDIYYLPLDNTCYATCPDHYYPSSPYCLICHYTCKNCTTNAVCATCLDLTGTYQTLVGDVCNCKTGYFDNGGGRCQLCNSSCVNCTVNQNNCTACHTGFYVNETYCKETCGDGVLYNLACDDGNVLSGDGCSEICMT